MSAVLDRLGASNGQAEGEAAGARTEASTGVVGRYKRRVLRLQHIAQVSDLQVVCRGWAARYGMHVKLASQPSAGSSRVVQQQQRRQWQLHLGHGSAPDPSPRLTTGMEAMRSSCLAGPFCAGLAAGLAADDGEGAEDGGGTAASPLEAITTSCLLRARRQALRRGAWPRSAENRCPSDRIQATERSRYRETRRPSSRPNPVLTCQLSAAPLCQQTLASSDRCRGGRCTGSEDMMAPRVPPARPALRCGCGSCKSGEPPSATTPC